MKITMVNLGLQGLTFQQENRMEKNEHSYNIQGCFNIGSLFASSTLKQHWFTVSISSENTPGKHMTFQIVTYGKSNEQIM